MSRWRRWPALVAAGIVAAGIGLVTGLLFAAAPANASRAGEPRLELSGATTSPGQVRFLLTPRDLPAGTSLDPATVTVSADDIPLRVTVEPATDTNGAPPRYLLVVLDANGNSSTAYRTGVRAALASLAESLPADVHLGLFAVTTQATEVLAPTVDRAAFTGALSTVSFSGDIDPVDGVEQARRSLAATAGAYDRRLLLVTDARRTFVNNRNAQIGASVAGTGLDLDVVTVGATNAAVGDLTTLAAAAGGQVRPAADAAGATTAVRDAGRGFAPVLAVSAPVPSVLSGATSVVRAEAPGVAAASLTVTFAVSQTVATLPAPADLGWVPTWLVYVIGLVVFVAIVAMALAVLWPRSAAHERIKQIAHFGPGRTVPAPKPEAAATPAPTTVTATVTARITRTALAASASVVRSGRLEDRIAHSLERAGLKLRPHEWVLLQALSAFAGLVLCGLSLGLRAAVVGLFVGWAGPVVYRALLTDRRGRQFAEQLPDGLQLIIGSLRSGFSLSQALETVVRESPLPLSAEFGRALAEHRLGADISDALERVAQRTGSDDLNWAVMAIRIQREVGGNLAEVLQNNVDTMRERARLRRQVRALSAEGRLSAWVLIVVPFVLGLFMFVYRRSYLAPLFTDPRGILLLAGGAVLFVVGVFWMLRVIRVEA